MSIYALSSTRNFYAIDEKSVFLFLGTRLSRLLACIVAMFLYLNRMAVPA